MTFATAHAAAIAGILVGPTSEPVIYKVAGAGAGTTIRAVIDRSPLELIGFEGVQRTRRVHCIIARDPAIGVASPAPGSDTITIDNNGASDIRTVVSILRSTSAHWELEI